MRSAIIAAAVAVLASAGTATADHLLTGKDIRNGSITGVDLKDRSVGSVDLRDGTIKSDDVGDSAIRHNSIVAGAVDSTTIDPATTTALESVDARTRAERSAPIEAATTTNVRADCPAGQVATGGGARIDRPGANPSDQAPELVASEPATDDAGVPRAWVATIRTTGTTSANRGTAVAFAICAP